VGFLPLRDSARLRLASPIARMCHPGQQRTTNKLVNCSRDYTGNSELKSKVKSQKAKTFNAEAQREESMKDEL